MPRNTLVDFFTDIAGLDGPAVVFDDGFRPRNFTYRQMAAMARAFASRLRTEAINKGDKVLIWSESRPGWIATLWGCILEGVILVPLDYRVSEDFLKRVSNITEAKALLIGEEVSSPQQFHGAIWRLAEIEDQWVEKLDTAATVEPDDTVEIVFTSGATAEPK